MARRSSAGSRSSRSSSAAGGSASGRGSRGPVARSDGRVDAPCPQCGTRYRVSQEALDVKIECQECHRVFFPKTTAGKRAHKEDHTKVYVGFGIGALILVVTFFWASSGGSEPETPKTPKYENVEVVTRGRHPRTVQIVNWANAVHDNSHLVITTHSDLPALAKMMELEASDAASVIAALQTHPSTQWLRDLDCPSGELASDEAMTASSGKALIYLVPEPGNKDYENNDRAELEVSFHMEGEQVKVEGWKIVRRIIRKTPDPNRPKAFKPNENIEAAKTVEITDSAGTRKVMESEPGPVPHWDGASPELRAKVDQVIADILRSADPESPGGLLNRATMSIRTLDERKAAVPRALNAMFELYGDVNANNAKLSLLDRALRDWTGGAHNYELRGTGDPAKDKQLRESAVRQWFAFWWRYSSGDLSDFIDMRENLDEPLEGETKDPGKKK